MDHSAEAHLARLADKTALELLTHTGLDWSPLDGNVCAAARFKRSAANAPGMVALLGGASSGKSTLFNTLLGSEVSRISAHAHETMGPVAAIHTRHRDQWQSWAESGLIFPGLDTRVLSDGEVTTGQVDTILLYSHDLAELAGTLLVDMPDVTSKMSADEGAVTQTLLPWFDALILVIDEERCFDAAVFSETVAFSRNLGPRVWVIFNRTAGDGGWTDEDRRRLADHATAQHAAGVVFSSYEPGAGYRPLDGQVRTQVVTWLNGLDSKRRGAELEAHLQHRCAEVVRTNVTRSEQFNDLRRSIDRELETLTAETRLTTDLLTAEERRLFGLGHRLVPLYDAFLAVRRRLSRRGRRGNDKDDIDFEKQTGDLAEVLRRNLEHRFRHATDRFDQIIRDSAYLADSTQGWSGQWQVPPFDEREWAVRIRAHIDAWRAEAGKQSRRGDVAALSLSIPLLLADILFLGGAGVTLTWAAAWLGGLFGTKGLSSLVQRSPAFKAYQTTVRAYQSFIREALTEQCEQNVAAIPRRHLRSTEPVYESILYWSTPGRR